MSGTPVSTPDHEPRDGPERAHGRPARRPGGQGAGGAAQARPQGRDADRAPGAGRLGGQPAHDRHDHLPGQEPRPRAARRQRVRRGRARAGEVVVRRAGHHLRAGGHGRPDRRGPAPAGDGGLPPRACCRAPPAIAAWPCRPRSSARRASSPSPRPNLSEQQLNLEKERQIGQPAIISLAENPTSSSSLPNRARTVILAAVIGLIVGVIVTFVWRGSPAGRAGRA